MNPFGLLHRQDDDQRNSFKLRFIFFSYFWIHFCLFGMLLCANNTIFLVSEPFKYYLIYCSRETERNTSRRLRTICKIRDFQLGAVIWAVLSSSFSVFLFLPIASEKAHSRLWHLTNLCAYFFLCLWGFLIIFLSSFTHCVVYGSEFFFHFLEWIYEYSNFWPYAMRAKMRHT